MPVLRRFKDRVRGALRREVPSPSPSANVEYNRWFWSEYAKRWSPDTTFIDDGSDPETSRREIKYRGDEWGREELLRPILEEFVFPYLGPERIVAEIGSGGGRLSVRVAPLVKELHCFDVSQEMLDVCRKTLATHPNVHYHLINSPEFDTQYFGRFDFVYAFDVFVHLDLHTIWRYFQSIRRTLREGGVAFLHTANLKSPDGWRRFASQQTYKPEGFYFVSPEIISVLIERGDWELVKGSSPDPSNLYLNRDYLFILRKTDICLALP